MEKKKNILLIVIIFTVLVSLYQVIIYFDIKINNTQSFFDKIKDTWWLWLFGILGLSVINQLYRFVRRYIKKHKKNNSTLYKCSVVIDNITNYYGRVYSWNWIGRDEVFVVNENLILEEIEKNTTNLVNKQVKISDIGNSIVPTNSTEVEFNDSELISVLGKMCLFNERKNTIFLQNTLYENIEDKLNKGSVSIELEVKDSKFKNLDFTKLNGKSFNSKNNLSFKIRNEK